MNVEKMINRYPIIDIVIIHVLRSMMSFCGIDEEFDTKIDT